MSTVIIEKVATAIRCTCGHLWLTASKSRYPTCPKCHSTISRKKHAVILESDTTRKLKEEKEESADSGPQNQNAAGKKIGVNYNGLPEQNT
jgi:predicted  nucleic acid-binding Zn-ribbon protein